VSDPSRLNLRWLRELRVVFQCCALSKQTLSGRFARSESMEFIMKAKMITLQPGQVKVDIFQPTVAQVSEMLLAIPNQAARVFIESRERRIESLVIQNNTFADAPGGFVAIKGRYQGNRHQLLPIINTPTVANVIEALKGLDPNEGVNLVDMRDTGEDLASKIDPSAWLELHLLKPETLIRGPDTTVAHLIAMLEALPDHSKEVHIQDNNLDEIIVRHPWVIDPSLSLEFAQNPSLDD
jgi:hypothetical protein